MTVPCQRWKVLTDYPESSPFVHGHIRQSPSICDLNALILGVEDVMNLLISDQVVSTSQIRAGVYFSFFEAWRASVHMLM